MRFLFFLPLLLLLLWSYAAMLSSIDVYPKLFRVIKIVAGLGGIVGFIAIFIAAAMGVHL